MVTEVRPRLVTADDLLDLSADGFCGELIRGELVEEMPPGFRHGKIVLKLGALLLAFVEPRRLGTLVSDSGVWLERNPDTVRGPDLAFFRSESVPLDTDIPGYADVVPDLVVEVHSPNDRRWQLHDKAHMWLYYGAEVVWVVLPERRSVDVYRSGQNTIRLSGGDVLDGLDVLPGFRCQLIDIFGPQPASADQPAGE